MLGAFPAFVYVLPFLLVMESNPDTMMAATGTFYHDREPQREAEKPIATTKHLPILRTDYYYHYFRFISLQEKVYFSSRKGWSLLFKFFVEFKLHAS